MYSKDLSINKVFDSDKKWLSLIPSFTFVVPCFNKQYVIRQCIELLKASRINQHRILVIDDGSNDSSLDIIKNVRDIDFFHSPVNTGWGPINNTALSAVDSDYVVFVDADYMVGTYGWIESWFLFSCNKNFGESGELHYCTSLWDMPIANGASFHSYMMSMLWLADDPISVGIKNRDCSCGITDHIGGNYKIYRTSVIKGVGGFMPGPSPCCTEVEISLRVKAAGSSLLPYRIPVKWTSSRFDSVEDIDKYYRVMSEELSKQRATYDSVGALLTLPENHSTTPTCYRS